MRTVNVTAQYTPLKETISTDEAIPTVLAEGVFADKSQVHLEDYNLTSAEAAALNRYNILYKTNLKIGTNQYTGDTFKIRVRCDDSKNALIAVMANDSVTMLEPTIDGKYLVFDGTNDINFAVVKKDAALITTLLIVAAVLFIILIILISKIIKKNKQGKRVIKQICNN